MKNIFLQKLASSKALLRLVLYFIVIVNYVLHALHVNVTVYFYMAQI